MNYQVKYFFLLDFVDFVKLGVDYCKKFIHSVKVTVNLAIYCEIFNFYYNITLFLTALLETWFKMKSLNH